MDSAEPTPVSRWSARSVARTNDLDDGVRGSVHAGFESKSMLMWLWCNVSTVMRVDWGRAETSAAGHPFARAMGAWSDARATRGVNQNDDRAGVRGSDNCTTARVLCPRCSRRHLSVGQGADVSVAQPASCSPSSTTGCGDLGDVAAAAGLDPFAVEGDLGGVRLALDGFDGRPSHEFAALLGDMSAPHDFV